VSVREQIEQAGRAPVLGWAQNRRVDLKHTDVRKTWDRIRRALNKTNKESGNETDRRA
jgi:hypothetical protein